ncbi:MAG TPA: non-canonical purine NTP pyrophosphatase, partial [Gemmatimonadales bacterium]|nr:non-canonical purine NTP pyrophosphatase [Gemmatimonadales bacterium]
SDQVDAANNAELVRRLAGAPPERRRARYRCVLVLLRDPGAVPESFEGSCAGRILESPVGTGGFGYDPYFFSDELEKSFGEATPAEKDGVSHRGRAVRALAAALERRPVPA